MHVIFTLSLRSDYYKLETISCEDLFLLSIYQIRIKRWPLQNEEGTEFLLRALPPNRTQHITIAVTVVYLGCAILGSSSKVGPGAGLWAHPSIWSPHGLEVKMWLSQILTRAHSVAFQHSQKTSEWWRRGPWIQPVSYLIQENWASENWLEDWECWRSWDPGLYVSDALATLNKKGHFFSPDRGRGSSC